jgi:predicted NBD/HSP70 family sugar kinase
MQALDKSDLKAANERVVLSLIHREPGISRNEIAQRSELSPAAITGIVGRLLQAGLVREERTESQGRLGRRPTALFVIPNSRLVVGVEITTFGATVALAGLDGELTQQTDIAFDEDPNRFLSAIHEALLSVLHQAPHAVLGVGVSVPGTMDPDTGRIVAATNLHWRDVDAMAVLKPGIWQPVFWENNSNLSAMAERWFRSPKQSPLDDFVFVTLRVGLGTGLIVNGQLARGARAHAGEFGHTIIWPDGRICSCGNRGCWEEYASDRALLREYGEGPAKTSIQIAKLAVSGDPKARAAVETVANALGLGLVNIVLSLNPSAIALDDFAAVAWPVVEPCLWRVLRERVPSYWLGDLEVFPSRQTPIKGAIASLLSRYFEGSLGSVID